MRGHLRLLLEPKNGDEPVVFTYEIEAEATRHGVKLFAHGEEAYLPDQAVAACVQVGKGATPLTIMMLVELIESQFEPWN
jgi:hypothetical protein